MARSSLRCIGAAPQLSRGFPAGATMDCAPIGPAGLPMDDHLDEQRLRRLIDVGRSLLSQLDLEAVLDQVLETAREITGARYAALGVLDRDRRELEQLHHARDRRRDAPRDRRPAARPRDPRRAHRQPAAAARAARRRSPEVLRLPARPSADGDASSACRWSCAARCGATSTSPRRRAARSSTPSTRSRSSSSRRGRRSRSRTRGSTRRSRRAATSSSSRRGASRPRARSPSRSARRWSSRTCSSSSPSAAARSSRRAAS